MSQASEMKAWIEPAFVFIPKRETKLIEVLATTIPYSRNRLPDFRIQTFASKKRNETKLATVALNE